SGFSSGRQSLIEGVLRVIKEAIENLKISIILPQMLANPKIVVKVLAGTNHERAIKLMQNFIRRREIILREKRNPLEDHGMIMIIDYFQSHKDIYSMFQHYFQVLTLKEQKLMRAFEMLLKSAKRHLDKDSNTQIHEERHLLKIYQENQQLKKYIGQYRLKIAQYRNLIRWKVVSKAAQVDNLKKNINTKILENEQLIEHEADKMYRTIRNYEKISVDKQNQIEQDLKITQDEYNQQSKETKLTEKQTREEKNKLLLQLQSMVKRYDATMGEKLIDNLNLEDKLKEAKKELNRFMVIYRQEEKLYNEIVVKREVREEQEKMHKILKYMMNRAARKIQKYWKKWRKELKSKSKRGRGKKIK
ncbi:hypothetical protein KR044_006675, partial [Drosophila immigrans]